MQQCHAPGLVTKTKFKTTKINFEGLFRLSMKIRPHKNYPPYSINEHDALYFATTVAPNNNAGNAMRADNSRDRPEGYANSMHTIQKVKNALAVIKSQLNKYYNLTEY